MKKLILNSSALLAALFAPALAFAQGAPNFTYVNSWIVNGMYYLRLSVTVITILLTVFFLISVLRYVMNKDASKAADLRKLMINGLIGLFISVAVWGIIRVAGNITGVDTVSGNQGQMLTCPPGLNDINGICQ